MAPGLIWICRFNGGVNFICFRLKIHFFGKFGPKNQNCQFKLKFAGVYSSTFVYSHFSSEIKFLCCLLSSSSWGIPMVDSKSKIWNLGLQIAGKCIFNIPADSRIAFTLLIKIIFSVNNSWGYVHSAMFVNDKISAAAAVFVGILEISGSFKKLTRKTPTTFLYVFL